MPTVKEQFSIDGFLICPNPSNFFCRQKQSFFNQPQNYSVILIYFAEATCGFFSSLASELKDLFSNLVITLTTKLSYLSLTCTLRKISGDFQSGSKCSKPN